MVYETGAARIKASFMVNLRGQSAICERLSRKTRKYRVQSMIRMLVSFLPRIPGPARVGKLTRP